MKIGGSGHFFEYVTDRDDSEVIVVASVSRSIVRTTILSSGVGSIAVRASTYARS